MNKTRAVAGAIDPEFWRARRVFLTGHTGFKGSWLALWFHLLEARVHGYALAPLHAEDAYNSAAIEGLLDSEIADVRDRERLTSAMAKADPEIVFHLAAQPLVRRSYADPVETFDVNVMGTVHLLEACRHLKSLKAVVVITTDKVYENADTGQMFAEADPLGGAEPYGYSKAATEMAVAAWRRAFLEARQIGVAAARAGNVIGGGDWSEDRLVPDAIKAFRAGETLRIRAPRAIRPWQHVVEPLKGYILLAQALAGDPAVAGGWNFGPARRQCVRVARVAGLLADAWGNGAAWQTDEAAGGPHEAATLLLDSAKAARELRWRPVLPVEEAVAAAVGWYRAHDQGVDAQTLRRMMTTTIRTAETETAPGSQGQ